MNVIERKLNSVLAYLRPLHFATIVMIPIGAILRQYQKHAHCVNSPSISNDPCGCECAIYRVVSDSIHHVPVQ